MVGNIYLRGGYWNALHTFWCLIETIDYMDVDCNDITISFRIIKV